MKSKIINTETIDAASRRLDAEYYVVTEDKIKPFLQNHSARWRDGKQVLTTLRFGGRKTGFPGTLNTADVDVINLMINEIEKLTRMKKILREEAELI